MSRLQTTASNPAANRLDPAEPLWKRAPARDADGRPLSDFMMLLPKLGKQPGDYIREVIDTLESIFGEFADQVVFADLNLKLNVLWVTVKPVPGICSSLPAAIVERIPEARLVADRAAMRR